MHAEDSDVARHTACVSYFFVAVIKHHDQEDTRKSLFWLNVLEE